MKFITVFSNLSSDLYESLVITSLLNRVGGVGSVCAWVCGCVGGVGEILAWVVWVAWVKNKVWVAMVKILSWVEWVSDVKKVSLKVLQSLQESTCAGASC